MTFDNSILTIVTFLPLVGALLLLFFPGRDEAAANVQRWVALVTTLATFVLTLFVWARFDPSNPGFQMVVNIPWIGDSIGDRLTALRTLWTEPADARDGASAESASASVRAPRISGRPRSSASSGSRPARRRSRRRSCGTRRS